MFKKSPDDLPINARERFLRKRDRVAPREAEDAERLVRIVERTYASISSLSGAVPSGASERVTIARLPEVIPQW